MIRLSLVIFFGVISGTITIMSLIIFSPSTIGAIGVTLWFVNLMIFLTSLLGLTFYLSKNKATNNQMIIHNFNSSVRSGFLLSFAITFLLALKSLRSLTIKDVILLGLILLIIEMYFRTKKVRTKKV
ncbi:MAG: hypothetical protein Q8P54_03180 [bacterium]|nr:hypothetical protein [bacterium]